MYDKLIFELAHESIDKTYVKCEVPVKKAEELLPGNVLRKDKPGLPELAENEVIRHFVHLSYNNHHVDKSFYPLGSCTMKYNPKVNETIAAMPGFAEVHPDQPEHMVQGTLEVMYNLQQQLLAITGLKGITLQPAAGAHGEFTGIKMIRKYHQVKGNTQKNIILIPDSAHGTNPASVAISGMIPVTIKSDANGFIDMEDFKAHLTDEVAGIMITNPSTLGIFEKNFKVVADMLHDRDALVYMDGANLNALLGIVRPGDIGADALHINLHKTFSTPHGGGGPGSGPVAVSDRLKDFLPVPVVEKNEKGTYYFDFNKKNSVGRMHPFHGNFGMLIRAYAYIASLGEEGVAKISRHAIINANYLLKKLSGYFERPHTETPMHEFVFSGDKLKEKGLKTLDFAKRLLDYGMHAPTVYFPLIVHEAIMIEPTESESKEMLDYFTDIVGKIMEEVETDPDLLKTAPHKTPFRRLNEVKANREMNITWTE